jgi:hypothetical protein
MVVVINELVRLRGGSSSFYLGWRIWVYGVRRPTEMWYTD